MKRNESTAHAVACRRTHLVQCLAIIHVTWMHVHLTCVSGMHYAAVKEAAFRWDSGVDLLAVRHTARCVVRGCCRCRGLLGQEHTYHRMLVACLATHAHATTHRVPALGGAARRDVLEIGEPSAPVVCVLDVARGHGEATGAQGYLQRTRQCTDGNGQSRRLWCLHRQEEALQEAC